MKPAKLIDKEQNVQSFTKATLFLKSVMEKEKALIKKRVTNGKSY